MTNNKLYVKYKIPFNKIGPDGKFHKTITIEKYGSGCTGCMIINAVTGYKYEYLVGSIDEFKFFKVIDTNHLINREPMCLFYDSPEQYEQHQQVQVCESIKNQWNERPQN